MLAWRKIERLFVPGDVWFDPLKLAAFKYRLKDNIDQISSALLAGEYKPHPLVPVPFPKSKKEGEEEIPIRQSFVVDISDQLVWVAVCNVIGVYLDTQMPAWSYGNRLYLHWWKDKNDRWQVGNYRNSTPSLYRNWNQSWPQMRKKITLSLKLLAGMERHLSKEERELRKKEQEVPDKAAHYARLKYLEEGYFPSRTAGSSPDKELFWCGIDLKKFYPHLNIKEIVDILLHELKREDDEAFVALLDHISTFQLDAHEYEGHEKDLELMGLHLDEAVFEKLPTGLLVAGFLANVYMLDIDRKADKYLNDHRDVIHFRYVDDHVIIARTKEALKTWVDEYVRYILNDEEEGLEINFKKAEPVGVLGEYDSDGKIKLSNYSGLDEGVLEKSGKLDPFYPTPLMTQTLQKVSMLSKEKLPLLTASEFEMVFKDLQTMLVTDIPEQEISKQTRISFACTMLSRLLMDGNVDYHHVYEVRRSLYEQVEKGWLEDNPAETKRRLALLYKETFEVSQEEKEMFTAFDYEQYEGLRKTIATGKEETKDHAETIFFLLRRAIREVPEKVKVWVRTFNFAVNHYPEGIKHIVDELNVMRRTQDKLHNLSVLYLESIVEMLAAESIMNILCRLKRDDYTNRIAKENDRRSVQQLAKIRFENEGFGFKAITEIMMQQACACYASLSQTLVLDSIGEVMPEENVDYGDGTLLDTCFWQIWKMDTYDLQAEDLDAAGELMGGVKVLDSQSPYFEGYLFRVLSMTDRNALQIQALLPVGLDSESLSQDLKYVIRMTDQTGEVFHLEQDRTEFPEGYVSLRDWIIKTSQEREYALRTEHEEFPRAFLNEARYSEWMSVKLMLSIVEAVRKQFDEEETDWNPEYLNPANILIKEGQIPMNWKDRKVEDPLFDVLLINTQVAGGDRYYTIPQLYDSLQPSNAVCYGLGLIFLHILTRKLFFPWIMNSPDYGFEWRRELNRLLNHGQVSSVNYKIVEECLTGWNRETIRMIREYREQQLDLFRVDELDHESKIYDIDQLKKRLVQAFAQVNNNLISVPGNAYRQLLEISVM